MPTAACADQVAPYAMNFGPPQKEWGRANWENRIAGKYRINDRNRKVLGKKEKSVEENRKRPRCKNGARSGERKVKVTGYHTGPPSGEPVPDGQNVIHPYVEMSISIQVDLYICIYEYMNSDR